MAANPLILADSNYPLLDVFWTMIELFLWIVWLFLLFRIFSDIFRSRDLSGWGKAGWSIFVLILPFIGVLVYLIVRGSTMHERDVRQAQAADEAFRSYVQDAASSSTAEELTKLAALHDRGVLSDAEFAAQKAKILG